MKEQIAAVLDDVFAMTGRPALYRLGPGADGASVSVRVEHGGRDAEGGEAMVKVRRSEVQDEPQNGAQFVCDGVVYTVLGIYAAPQTTPHVWACVCRHGRRANWKK